MWACISWCRDRRHYGRALGDSPGLSATKSVRESLGFTTSRASFKEFIPMERLGS